MNTIRKSLGLEGVAYYIKHLSIINGVLPVQLTPKEITVLAHFLALDKNIVEDEHFNTLARRKVREQTGLSAGGLGNYLSSMIEKGFLIKSEVTHKITIREFIIPNSESQVYLFKLKNNSYEEIQSTTSSRDDTEMSGYGTNQNTRPKED